MAIQPKKLNSDNGVSVQEASETRLVFFKWGTLLLGVYLEK